MKIPSFGYLHVPKLPKPMIISSFLRAGAAFTSDVLCERLIQSNAEAVMSKMYKKSVASRGDRVPLPRYHRPPSIVFLAPGTSLAVQRQGSDIKRRKAEYLHLYERFELLSRRWQISSTAVSAVLGRADCGSDILASEKAFREFVTGRTLSRAWLVLRGVDAIDRIVHRPDQWIWIRRPFAPPLDRTPLQLLGGSDTQLQWLISVLNRGLIPW